jgi:hypothetical protein
METRLGLAAAEKREELMGSNTSADMLEESGNFRGEVIGPGDAGYDEARRVKIGAPAPLEPDHEFVSA